MPSDSILKIPALLLCVFSFFMYYVYFFCRVESKDYSIQYLKNLRTATDWIKRHKLKQDPATVQQAIQALRNTIYVGTFVGGSAILLAFNLINTIDKSNFNDFRTLLFVKDTRALILSVLLFCSFLNWALVIRHAAELGFLIDSDSEVDRLSVIEDDSLGRQTRITKLAIRMTVHFSFGFRFMYISIPFAFISVGPIAMIVATIVILVFHYDLDFSSRYRITEGPYALSSKVREV